jgi:hypothetical protein
MRRSLTISFAVLVFSFPVLAQEEPIVAPVAEQQDPTPGAETSRRELPVLTSGRVSANTVTDGDKGEVILTGTAANFINAGVLLRATTSGVPNIAAVLGNTGTSANFSVFDSSNTTLFRVDSTGAVGIGTTAPAADLHLFRGDAFTTMRVEHTAAGTSGGSRGARVVFYENGTMKAGIASVGSGSTSAGGGANALQLWNYTSNGAVVLATNSTERMRINADGRVGIGIATPPSYLLHSQSNVDGVSPIGAQLATVVDANADQNDITAHFNTFQNVVTGVTNTGEAMGVRTGGFLNGAGTLNSTWGLYVRTGVYTGATGTVNSATGMRIAVLSGSGTVNTGVALHLIDVPAQNAFGILQEGSTDINQFAGQVRVGGGTSRTEKLVVTGDAYVTGTLSGTNIKAHYQDLAEWVPADADLAPGTVVVLHPERPNEVISSAKAYDTSVAGVVSAQPGIILGEGGEGKEQIATTGRVKVRVDARKAPIRIGDLLVTSDVPGTAMRSESIELGGHQFHRPGTIVGKALEAIDGGVGEILVLLSLQ